MDAYPHIEVDPDICAGLPHIRGTQISVNLIAREVEFLRMTPNEVIAAHPHLTLAQVHAALAYFYDHRAEVEAEMRKTRDIEDELRAVPIAGSGAAAAAAKLTRVTLRFLFADGSFCFVWRRLNSAAEPVGQNLDELLFPCLFRQVVAGPFHELERHLELSPRAIR
jgi:uncharacterized protein (DUF433 family)